MGGGSEASSVRTCYRFREWLTLFLIQHSPAECECQCVDRLLPSTHLARQRNIITVLLSLSDHGDKPSPG